MDSADAQAPKTTDQGFAFGAPADRPTGRSAWVVALPAFVAGALISGTAVFFLVEGRRNQSADDAGRSGIIDAQLAPPPAWYDSQAACDQVRDLERSFRQPDSNEVFSEARWLTQLVNATELAGAAHAGSEGPDIPQGDRALMDAADGLRMVTIGGGSSHPQFAVKLVEFLDTCDRHFP